MNSRLLFGLAAAFVVGSIILLWYGSHMSRHEHTAADSAAPAMPRTPPAPSTASVVAVVRDLPQGHVLTLEDLTVRQVEREAAGHYTDPRLLVGEITRLPVVAGSVLEPRHLVQGGQVARSLLLGERAVAVRVDEVIAGGGFIAPEDYVDVLLFLKANTKEVPQSQAQVVMRRVRVLALGDIVVDDASGAGARPQPASQGDKKGRLDGLLPGAASNDAAGRASSSNAGDDRNRQTGKRSRSAVLAVQEADISRLMLAAHAGELRLAVLPTAETVAIRGTGETAAVPVGPLAPADNPALRRVRLADLAGPQTAQALNQRKAVRSRAAARQPTLVIFRGAKAERVSVGR